MKQSIFHFYLHCPSLLQFLLSPAMTFFFKSETEKHLNDESQPGDSDDPRSLTRSLESCCEEPSEPAESSPAILKLGI